MLLAQSSFELVTRCYEHVNRLLDKEELKKAFVSFVFETYQEEVVASYGLDAFHEHLESIKLTNCRKDFDTAVEDWYLLHIGNERESACFHDILFSLVREAIVTYHSGSREELIRDVTKLLTSPTGFVAKWKNELQRSMQSYYQYLMKLGIRTYADIESLVDAWLIEYPNAFDKTQQRLFAKPSRRGRPNNAELTLLLEKVHEWKPNLTPQEKERIRKIYYYHRKSLTTLDMIEKFKNYVQMKSAASIEEETNQWAN
ncbi:hypothetical protein [Brevibacillus sp. SYP-B805]|uniref:hypothetical protein n=1 Tax=Brevibacillus sp. SYP-B805 TaxID=1578199 RepID=UPI001F499ACC|nr:hypothetical protein [Brevibacillus sp. SYP-B805]